MRVISGKLPGMKAMDTSRATQGMMSMARAPRKGISNPTMLQAMLIKGSLGLLNLRIPGATLRYDRLCIHGLLDRGFNGVSKCQSEIECKMVATPEGSLHAFLSQLRARGQSTISSMLHLSSMIAAL